MTTQNLYNNIDVNLALKINKYVHELLPEAPHDIGLNILKLINDYEKDNLEQGIKYALEEVTNFLKREELYDVMVWKEVQDDGEIFIMINSKKIYDDCLYLDLIYNIKTELIKRYGIINIFFSYEE